MQKTSVSKSVSGSGVWWILSVDWRYKKKLRSKLNCGPATTKGERNLWRREKRTRENGDSHLSNTPHHLKWETIMLGPSQAKHKETPKNNRTELFNLFACCYLQVLWDKRTPVPLPCPVHGLEMEFRTGNSIAALLMFAFFALFLCFGFAFFYTLCP